MKKEVIIVPKDKCPLNVLAEMGERTKNAWIFLHQSALEKLLSTADEKSVSGKLAYHELHWNATEEFPATSVLIEYNTQSDWSEVVGITATDIAFSLHSNDPEDIYFLKMDE